MDLAGRIFAMVAIPSTLVLVVQTILLFFGIGDDIDGNYLYFGDGVVIYNKGK